MGFDGHEVEFLEFFSDQGSFTVKVKFEEKGISIAQRKASAEDVASLLRLLESSEQPAMTFDDHPGIVSGIRIDPVGNNIVLSVRFP